MIYTDISLEDTVCQVSGQIVSDMDEEKVMLSIENGKYYNLGDVGGVIWESMKQPISVRELIRKLTERYDVTETRCEKQVIAFLHHLLEHGLIYVPTNNGN